MSANYSQLIILDTILMRLIIEYNDIDKGVIMNQTQAIEHVKDIKNKYEKQLMTLANVVGVGIGFKQISGTSTNRVALVVNVEHKKSLAELDQQDIIPTEIDGVAVDVQEVGRFSAF
jgi:hypothetical protein